MTLTKSKSEKRLVDKSRTLVLSSRGIISRFLSLKVILIFRQRHLMLDVISLLSNSKRGIYLCEIYF